MFKLTDTCFSCGAVIRTPKCHKCGYSFDIEDKCPRKNGAVCLHTKKICSIKDYDTCKVLRAND